MIPERSSRRSSDSVKVSRSRCSAMSSSSPGSWIGTDPSASAAILRGSMSRIVTSWPMVARQTPVTSPTYPAPTTPMRDIIVPPRIESLRGDLVLMDDDRGVVPLPDVHLPREDHVGPHVADRLDGEVLVEGVRDPVRHPPALPEQALHVLAVVEGRVALAVDAGAPPHERRALQAGLHDRDVRVRADLRAARKPEDDHEGVRLAPVAANDVVEAGAGPVLGAPRRAPGQQGQARGGACG